MIDWLIDWLIVCSFGDKTQPAGSVAQRPHAGHDVTSLWQRLRKQIPGQSVGDTQDRHIRVANNENANVRRKKRATTEHSPRPTLF